MENIQYLFDSQAAEESGKFEKDRRKKAASRIWRDGDNEVLSLYFIEMHRSRLLSAEEEIKIAREMHIARQQKILMMEQLLILLAESIEVKAIEKKYNRNLTIKSSLIGILKDAQSVHRLCIEIKKTDRLIDKGRLHSTTRKKLIRERIGKRQEVLKLLSKFELRELDLIGKALKIEALLKRSKQRSVDTGKKLNTILKQVCEAEAKSKQAKNFLIRSNLALVIKFAKKLSVSGLPLADLIQEGNIGLMRAVDKFDYSKGYRLSTYACWWIQQNINRYIDDKSSDIRIPVHIQEKLKKIKRQYRYRSQDRQTVSSRTDIAEEVGLPPEKLEKLFRLPQKALSLETPVGDGEVSLKDFIADQKLDSPLDQVAGLQLHSATTKALQALTPREERIIRLRFGIGVGREHTLDEVGNKFGLTRERIRQIEKKALEKMRYLRKFQILKSFSEN